jgi:hypothetical protein
LHIKYKKKIPNLITIIIPRHIERTNEIVHMLEKKNLTFVKHSEKRKNINNSDIYIVDSYGESKSFYKISNVVFLGGSLVSRGGQNPLEALRFGCNILHGSYTFNFKDVYKMLEKEKLSIKVNNSKDLEKKALNLFKNKRNIYNKIKKPKFWDKRGNISLFSILLLPLSLITIIKNYYENGKIKRNFYDFRTICVGNIYIGGTGKTPLVNNLASHFKKRFKTAIIKKNYTSHTDEKKLLGSKHKVIFEKTRELSLSKAEQEKTQVVIFDDGLQ